MVRKNLAGRVYDEYSPGALSEQIALWFLGQSVSLREGLLIERRKPDLLKFSRTMELSLSRSSGGSFYPKDS
ncbi:MAG: hypothetical protein IJ733_11535 [Lachnospiraceae bacterium]|nr:hypothetical protein [Lachnospiraceae bacterium]